MTFDKSSNHTPRVESLTKRLLAAGLVPASVAADAIHIATASVHGMDFLVTWNFKHIANPHIQQALREEVAFFGERRILNHGFHGLSRMKTHQTDWKVLPAKEKTLIKTKNPEFILSLIRANP